MYVFYLKMFTYTQLYSHSPILLFNHFMYLFVEYHTITIIHNDRHVSITIPKKLIRMFFYLSLNCVLHDLCGLKMYLAGVNHTYTFLLIWLMKIKIKSGSKKGMDALFYQNEEDYSCDSFRYYLYHC